MKRSFPFLLATKLQDFCTSLDLAAKAAGSKRKRLPLPLLQLRGQANSLVRQLCKAYGFTVASVKRADPPNAKMIMSIVHTVGVAFSFLTEMETFFPALW